MNFDFCSKRIITSLAIGFIVMTGTYNAIVINSESKISGEGYSLARRLDEVYGNIEYNRGVAATKGWKKIQQRPAAIANVKMPKPVHYEDKRSSSSDSSSSVAETSSAAVQEELSLSLAAVANPKKWPQGLTNANFAGNLTTNAGVIENLEVSLPNDEGLSISFSEMNGNVFEYDFQGELYSGMMYQDAPNSYVVSLTNGPLEGTRLSFKSEPTYEQQLEMEEKQRELAESNDSNAGVYEGEPQQVAAVDPARDLQLQQQQRQQYPQAEQAPVDNIYAQEQGFIDQQMQAQEQAQNPTGTLDQAAM